MFYSHEILTSRKYGVATVWLVATLGASEARRKLNKAEIQKVNVPKACETITNPETPLALRLQSNLLFGVSKVYSQQCAFVLNDAEHVRAQVRQAMDAIRAAAITSTKTHLAKKDQITLSDDPNFNIELDFLLELDILASGPRPGIPDSNLQSLAPQSTQQSIEEQIAELSQEMQAHSDDVSGGGEDFSSPSRSRDRNTSVDQHATRLGNNEFQEELPGGLLEDVGFTIGEDGSLQDAPPAQLATAGDNEDTGTAMNEATRGSRLPSEQLQDMTSQQEQDLPPLGDDFDLFPDAQAFSPRRSHEPGQQDPLDATTDPVAQQQDVEGEPAQDEVQSAAAPSRARRQRRALPLDTQMELRNQDITDWNNNYVQHMQQDAIHRFHQRSAHTAKLNAQAWLNGAGLLGIGNLLNNDNIPAALQMFTGVNVLMPITPPGQGSPTSSKRSRSSSSPSPSRRVRPRLTSQEAEQGRAGEEEPQVPQLDDDLSALPVDDADLPVEVGREAGTPLADRHSSQMPWNLSRVSSAQRRFNLTGGVPGSDSVAGGPLSQGMRGSSMAAPSPLVGRDRREEEEELLGDETFQLPMEDTEMHDAPTAEPDGSQLDSQGIRRSSLPWAVKAMDTEQLNFVAYLMDKVDEKKSTSGVAQDDRVEFEEAFAPEETDKVVACQALMHVLALNGKGVLAIEQDNDEGFRPISMTVNEVMAGA